MQKHADWLWVKKTFFKKSQFLLTKSEGKKNIFLLIVFFSVVVYFNASEYVSPVHLMSELLSPLGSSGVRSCSIVQDKNLWGGSF